jgi:predicted permease
MMMLGFLIRKNEWLNQEELRKINNVVFNLLFPFLVFSSIYHSDLSTSVQPAMITFGVLAITLTCIFAFIIIPRIEPNRASCGAMIQTTYRSNFVLLGLPLVANLYPNADLGMTAIAIAVLIPFYNAIAVVTLEIFRGGHPSPKRILRNIATNPLIIGCAAGLLAIPFHIHPVITQTISQLAATATPMALILLGASFQLNRSLHLRRNLLISTITRLILVPGIFLPIAACVGFRGIAFATLLGVFATPCSVSSFIMAQQMDSDGELAGAAVVYTSFLSCFTMCLFIFVFKQLGVL